MAFLLVNLTVNCIFIKVISSPHHHQCSSSTVYYLSLIHILCFVTILTGRGVQLMLFAEDKNVQKLSDKASDLRAVETVEKNLKYAASSRALTRKHACKKRVIYLPVGIK